MENKFLCLECNGECNNVTIESITKICSPSLIVKEEYHSVTFFECLTCHSIYLVGSTTGLVNPECEYDIIDIHIALGI